MLPSVMDKAKGFGVKYWLNVERDTPCVVMDKLLLLLLILQDAKTRLELSKSANLYSTGFAGYNDNFISPAAVPEECR